MRDPLSDIPTQSFPSGSMQERNVLFVGVVCLTLAGPMNRN